MNAVVFVALLVGVWETSYGAASLFSIKGHPNNISINSEAYEAKYGNVKIQSRNYIHQTISTEIPIPSTVVVTTPTEQTTQKTRKPSPVKVIFDTPNFIEDATPKIIYKYVIDHRMKLVPDLTNPEVNPSDQDERETMEGKDQNNTNSNIPENGNDNEANESQIEADANKDDNYTLALKNQNPTCPILEDTLVDVDNLDYGDLNFAVYDPSRTILYHCDLGTVLQTAGTSRKPQTDLEDVQYVNHTFYRSAFIANESYFGDHWGSMCASQWFDAQKPFQTKYGHRFNFRVSLKFNFTFYGRHFSEVMVSPKGYLSISETSPADLKTTQYAAPLMAPFDDNCDVLVCNDESKLSIIWKDIFTKTEPNEKFTFAITLYNNDNIVFAYKDVPKPVGRILGTVKVGLSDAYATFYNNSKFETRTKHAIYNSISFSNYDIQNETIIQLKRQPSCPEHTDCISCTNADPSLNCAWCPVMQRCSASGRVDAYYVPWYRWSCRLHRIMSAENCPAEDSYETIWFKSLTTIDWALCK